MNTQEKLEALKKRIREFENAFDQKGVTQWLRTEDREEMEEVMVQADRLMEHIFLFQDRWDMEPCSVPYQLKPMEWEISPNGDPEWIYMLNRHEYFKKLMLAGWFTGEEKYLRKLKELIVHWISHVSLQEKGPAVRTIDTGIRCRSWAAILAHLMAMGLVEDEEALKILRSISEQLTYLRDSYVDKYRLSNWGVLQTTGILVNGLLFQEFLDPELIAWALEELKQELELQVYEDGSHWEQSILYHMEVVNACSEVLAMAQMLGRSVDKKIRDTIYSMYRYVQMAAGPDHMQQAQGDSDVTDVRDVLSCGALLFRDGVLKYGGYQKLGLEHAWLFGMQGIRQYEKLEAVCPDELAGIYPESGNYYFRTGWQEDANYTYLQNGPLGSSHGHVDLTHISNYYKGTAFLTDSGRYSYMEQEPLRRYLKNAQAHNVCRVEGAEAGLADGSWSYAYYGDCLKNYVKAIDGIHYAEMPFLSKEPGGSMAFHNRRALVFPEGIWLIADEIRMDGVHKSQASFHFAPEVKLRSEKAGEALVERDGIRLKLGSEKELVWKKDVLSRRYNEMEEHLVFTAKEEWKDEGWMISWLAPEEAVLTDAPVFQAEKKESCSRELVTSKEIWMDGSLKYVVILFRHEVFRGRKVFSYEGVPFYGKAVVLRKKEDGFEILRFRA